MLKMQYFRFLSITILILVYLNAKGQDSLEIYLTVDNWTRNKIEIIEKNLGTESTFMTNANSFKRLTSCCCKGYKLQRVLLKKDTGQFYNGDTLFLEIAYRSILSPFKRKFNVVYVIEKNMFLLIFINRNLPFYTWFGYNIVTRRHLYCI